MASEARKISNIWIAKYAKEITGKVLSIGSGDDSDWCGSKYRKYFLNSSLYLTSDIAENIKTDLRVDVRSMIQIKNGEYDCLFCAGTLEHVDDMFSAMSEMARVLKPGGVLLLGVPFGQAIHRVPQDFWRMTIYGLRYLLDRFGFDDKDILQVPRPVKEASRRPFPSCYWSKSVRRKDGAI